VTSAKREETRERRLPTLIDDDIQGNGLPDIIQMNGSQQPLYWTNRGNRKFSLPRTMKNAPTVSLAEPGVQMLDADGAPRAHRRAGPAAAPMRGWWLTDSGSAARRLG